jgi:hypothetical protein
MSTDKALSLVGPITQAYNAAEKAGADALHYALECGKHLNSAYETVTAEKSKGKWKQWRETNLPKVSEETERLYRRLAAAVEKREDAFAKCKSIRTAIKHLSGLDENLNPKPPAPRPQRTGSSATGLQPPETDTPSGGLKVELENAAADEIIGNIQDDADKLEEVAKASIAKLTPDKVCRALTKAWDADRLRDLNRQVTAYLATLGSTPQSTSARPDLRRQLS